MQPAITNTLTPALFVIAKRPCHGPGGLILITQRAVPIMQLSSGGRQQWLKFLRRATNFYHVVLLFGKRFLSFSRACSSLG
jgi:hypothetical protein